MAAFVKAAELGSFAAAGTALGMSAQMVAKHVAFLENRVGARLLNRTTRRQSLTEIGHTYCQRCRQTLAEAEWADAVGNEARAEPRGRLRISAPVSFGSTSLVSLIARYLRDHPAVEVDLVLADRLVDLVGEEFEAAFRIGHLADSTLIAHELAPFRLVLCAAPGYLQARGTPSTPADLTAHECLGYARGPSLDEWRFAREGRIRGARGPCRLRVNDAKALLSAAMDGFGIAMIAHDLARDALASGRLVTLLPDYVVPIRPMHLVYLGDRRQTPKLKSFIDAAIKTFTV